MDWTDFANGLLSFIGAMTVLLNIKSIYDHKSSVGVSWINVAFFFAWSIWMLFYYVNLHQWFSFIGTDFLVSIDGWWLGLVIEYR